MLSEGVHSLVDTGNELVLLYGLRRAQKPPDRAHPFGHGREHELDATHWLIDSYHCSRYNTATRRLTAEMFEQVVARACERAQLPGRRARPGTARD